MRRRNTSGETHKAAPSAARRGAYAGSWLSGSSVCTKDPSGASTTHDPAILICAPRPASVPAPAGRPRDRRRRPCSHACSMQTATKAARTEPWSRRRAQREGAGLVPPRRERMPYVGPGPRAEFPVPVCVERLPLVVVLLWRVHVWTVPSHPFDLLPLFLYLRPKAKIRTKQLPPCIGICACS